MLRQRNWQQWSISSLPVALTRMLNFLFFLQVKVVFNSHIVKNVSNSTVTSMFHMAKETFSAAIVYVGPLSKLAIYSYFSTYCVFSWHTYGFPNTCRSRMHAMWRFFPVPYYGDRLNRDKKRVRILTMQITERCHSFQQVHGESCRQKKNLIISASYSEYLLYRFGFPPFSSRSTYITEQAYRSRQSRA